MGCIAVSFRSRRASRLVADIRLIRGGEETSHAISKDAEKREFAKNTTVEAIIDYLKNAVCDGVMLPQLCDRFFMGKSHLTEIFKESTGKSPMQFYNDLKIEEAKKLLKDSKLSVGEISDVLGYSGIHSFSRSFKNSTGFSPLEYKKSIF